MACGLREVHDRSPKIELKGGLVRRSATLSARIGILKAGMRSRGLWPRCELRYTFAQIIMIGSEDSRWN
jgi:hypothetical protein